MNRDRDTKIVMSILLAIIIVSAVVVVAIVGGCFKELLCVHVQSAQLKIETDDAEGKEASLVADCVRELQEKTWQVRTKQPLSTCTKKS